MYAMDTQLVYITEIKRLWNRLSKALIKMVFLPNAVITHSRQSIIDI